MRTLIVDDEYICRRIMHEMIRDLGDYEAVGNGLDAVAAFTMAAAEGKPFDLVLLDIEMPDIDGHEALRRIREFETSRSLAGRKLAKVIMTTVRKDPESVFAAFRNQCEAYMIKPVMRESLLQHLRHLRLIPDA